MLTKLYITLYEVQIQGFQSYLLEQTDLAHLFRPHIQNSGPTKTGRKQSLLLWAYSIHSISIWAIVKIPHVEPNSPLVSTLHDPYTGPLEGRLTMAHSSSR